jgi:hypothetical protein
MRGHKLTPSVDVELQTEIHHNWSSMSGDEIAKATMHSTWRLLIETRKTSYEVEGKERPSRIVMMLAGNSITW